MKRLTFKRQLKKQVTSKTESKELLSLARQIEALELPTLSKSAKSQIADDIGFAYHPYRKTFVRSWAGAMAVLAITVLVFAQSAKPGSALYSTRKVSDKVRTTITHNVPLLSSPDESPLHEANHITGSDNSNKNSGRQSGSGSGTGSSSTSSQSGSDDGSRSGSGSSGSGSSGSSSGGLEQTSTGSTGSGSSGSSGSGGGGGGGSGSGRDSGRTDDH